MGVQVHCSNVRYAVIQASSHKDRPERLVIAYQNEDCLRDLIAGPSIFGLGFASREEAMANLENHISDGPPSKQKSRIRAMFHKMHRATAELEASGIEEQALKVGDRAPSFVLFNQDHVQVSSSDLPRQGPLVISFFREHW